ncbi:ABC transporter substrate-binding protein [Staphylococcus chromogenes]|uniref:ABC transporter substrate-binding protein n=1 Tax=Staphylococcus chromogenes TaxID=46126 RepID=UPI000D033A32|nr:ABC transporter substrate-binding protein [Staphylococcus chromogenes]MCE4970544.1 ABC transporter substrate-binding protein [Staphylococcus chromogenes]MDT0671683.1 ABC transporter substrate-binding protein [Staphylococcus chromogenes]MDT0673876.1 ABC transporter substrate-binding protein [Staphylococcus chromogenes]MDT0697101.1 ABC transporter substrate-binding protein [Staphylococcus chromogenes]MDU0480739.1 ABC transporter substrate-binding protein [Staphylococcus chromogenes]
MKGKSIFYVIIMSLLLLAGCNFNDDHFDETGKTTNKVPNRIISLIPSNTEILYELGLGDHVVGVSTVDDYPKEVRHKTQFDAMKLNKEALIKAQPDLILTHESQKASQEKVLKSLENSGIKVVYVKDAQSLNEMYQSFEQIGQATNKEKEAQTLVKETKANVEKVVNKAKSRKAQPKVFIEIASEPEIYTVGKQTFMNDMLTKLKAKNVFDDHKGWPTVSKEDIIKKNPDVMLTTSGISTKEYQSLVQQRSGFEDLNAVKKQRVEALNDDLLSRPGPRIDEAMKKLSDAIDAKK